RALFIERNRCMFDGTIKIARRGGAAVSGYESEPLSLPTDDRPNAVGAMAPYNLPAQLYEWARWIVSVARQHLVLFSLSYAAALLAALTYIWTAAPWYSSSTFI